MRYFLLEATFLDCYPHGPVLKSAIQDHLQYLQRGFESGRVLIGGPIPGPNGDLLLFKAESRGEAELFCQRDPAVVMNVQHYRIVEFEPAYSDSSAWEWLNS